MACTSIGHCLNFQFTNLHVGTGPYGRLSTTRTIALKSYIARRKTNNESMICPRLICLFLLHIAPKPISQLISASGPNKPLTHQRTNSTHQASAQSAHLSCLFVAHRNKSNLPAFISGKRYTTYSTNSLTFVLRGGLSLALALVLLCFAYLALLPLITPK